MINSAIYVRVGNPVQLDGYRQRDELLDKFGDTHEIVAEYRDHANGSHGVKDRPGLKKLLEDAAKGEFDVLLCTHPSVILCLAVFRYFFSFSMPMTLDAP